MILLLTTLAWACPPLDDAVERLNSAILSGVDPALPRDDVGRSLRCAEASTTVIARYYLAEGAAAFFAGDPVAPRWLAAARRLDPEWFDDRFGDAMRAAWTAAVPDGAGTLRVDIDATVDGTLQNGWPIPVLAGPAVVQVVGRHGDVRFGKAIDIAPGEAIFVATTLGPEPLLRPDRSVRSPALLVAGGAAALLAGVAAGVALAENSNIGMADDLGHLDAARQRQAAFGYSAYGLGALAVAGVGVWFVLP